jgi:aryl-alcohol dehydrogenase-like predicted oxidoreductase
MVLGLKQGRSMRATYKSGDLFQLGGDMPVHRLGYVAMQLPGSGVWGEPEDAKNARNILRHVIELGVNFIDTADSYGPDVSERLIGEALHPYPDDLVIATKGGLVRPGPGKWEPNGRPEHLRKVCKGSLQRLRVERIDLYQLHRIDPDVPLAESLGAIKEMRDEGLIRHIGLSNVSVEQIEEAKTIASIVSVQNRYNLGDRKWDAVVDYCGEQGIAFLPWFPLATGKLAQPGGKLDRIAEAHDATPAQIALAWLLHRSPVILPIPGTSNHEHLEANVAAGAIDLDDDEIHQLGELNA